MGNRSNINLVGNTTQGQNLGTGEGIYVGKSVGNILQYKSLSVTGTTMAITCDDNNIYFSANTGGGDCVIVRICQDGTMRTYYRDTCSFGGFAYDCDTCMIYNPTHDSPNKMILQGVK